MESIPEGLTVQSCHSEESGKVVVIVVFEGLLSTEVVFSRGVLCHNLDRVLPRHYHR